MTLIASNFWRHIFIIFSNHLEKSFYISCILEPILKSLATCTWFLSLVLKWWSLDTLDKIEKLSVHIHVWSHFSYSGIGSGFVSFSLKQTDDLHHTFTMSPEVSLLQKTLINSCGWLIFLLVRFNFKPIK